MALTGLCAAGKMMGIPVEFYPAAGILSFYLTVVIKFCCLLIIFIQNYNKYRVYSVLMRYSFCKDVCSCLN